MDWEERLKMREDDIQERWVSFNHVFAGYHVNGYPLVESHAQPHAQSISIEMFPS